MLLLGKNTQITMQQTSKWPTHLPYLQLGTLHDSL